MVSDKYLTVVDRMNIDRVLKEHILIPFDEYNMIMAAIEEGKHEPIDPPEYYYDYAANFDPEEDIDYAYDDDLHYLIFIFFLYVKILIWYNSHRHKFVHEGENVYEEFNFSLRKCL